MTRRVLEPRLRLGKEGRREMSDETTTSGTGGWSSTDAAGSAPQSQEPGAGERVGFCQDCGKPLTADTVRPVGTGVFCEPCLQTRVGVPGGAPGYTTVPNYGTASPHPVAPRDPSPGLAALLGVIPGAGAVYNGQYGKGIAHLVIFVILVSLASDVNGLFGFFVAGWEIYMMIEAHHTAVAMRDGLPLPNPFGFNDIGERMGFGKNWGVAARMNVAGSGTPPPGATTAAAAPGYAPVSSTAPGYVPVGAAPDWVGYVPPTAFGAAAAQQEAMAAQAREQAAQSAAYYSQVPYAPTYAGPAYSTVPPVGAVPSAAVLPPELPSRRFPVGALWLIGLGILILLANILPDWQMSARWWPPILFAGLSTWLFTRRLRSGVKLICVIRWPVILMTLAIMFALHAAYFAVTFGLTVSVLLIVFGGLLLLERTAGASPVYEPPVSYSVVPSSVDVDAEAEAARSRAAFTESDPDSTKGGQ